MSSNLSELNISLLSVLECPICLMYMARPIRQCRNGHNICGNCFEKINTCPTCRNEFIETRNYPLEEIASKMEFPCDFKNQGCTVFLKFDELQKHNKICRYGNRRCAVRKCKWKGVPTVIMEHMKATHPTQLLQSDAGYHFTLLDWDWLSLKTNEWQVFILSDLKELFWVHAKLEATNGKVLVGVQHVTSACDNRFLYEIKLQGQEASSVYRAPTISDVVQMNTIFVAESCFCVTIRALKQFMINGDDLMLKVKVELL